MSEENFMPRDAYIVPLINKIASHASDSYQKWSSETISYGIDACARDCLDGQEMPEPPPYASLSYPITNMRDAIIVPITNAMLKLTSKHYQRWIFGARNYGIASMINDSELQRARPENVYARIARNA